MESYFTKIFISYLFDIGIINSKTVTDLITIYTNIKKEELYKENILLVFKKKMISSLVYYMNSLRDEQKENLCTNIVENFFVDYHKKRGQQLKSIINHKLIKQNIINSVSLIKNFYKWNKYINFDFNIGSLITTSRDNNNIKIEENDFINYNNDNNNNKTFKQHNLLFSSSLKQLKKVPTTPTLDIANVSPKIASLFPKHTKNHVTNKCQNNKKKNSNTWKIKKEPQKKVILTISRSKHNNSNNEQIFQDLYSQESKSRKHKSRSIAHQKEKSWDKKERENFGECTFTPTINSAKSKSIFENKIPVYERLYNAKQKYDTKKALKAVELDHLCSKENTFKPELISEIFFKKRHSFSPSKRTKNIDDMRLCTAETPHKTKLRHSQSGKVLKTFNNDALKLKSDIITKHKSKSFIDNPNIDYQKLEQVYSQYKAKIKRNNLGNEKYSKVEKEEITKKIIQKLYGSNKEFISNDNDLLEHSNGCLSNKSNKNNDFNFNKFVHNEPREQLYIEEFYLRYNK